MQSAILDQIIILALMMAVGIVFRKLRVLTDEVNYGLTKLLINLTMPCMILYSFDLKFTPAMAANALTVLIYSVVIHIGLIGFCALMFLRFSRAKRAVFNFATIFSNCGFVGYPVAQGLFGQLGVFYTSIFTIPFNIFMWSYGVMLFTGERDWKKLARNLINTPMIAIFAGLVIFLASIPIPKPVLQTLSGIGNMTTPISMFIIGSMLADIKLRDVFAGLDVYYVSLIKLVIAPMICLAVMKLIHAEMTLAAICVLMVAMPAGAMVGVFAEKYDRDRVAASRSVFITTILSVITIPAVFAWM